MTRYAYTYIGKDGEHLKIAVYGSWTDIRGGKMRQNLVTTNTWKITYVQNTT